MNGQNVTYRHSGKNAFCCLMIEFEVSNNIIRHDETEIEHRKFLTTLMIMKLLSFVILAVYQQSTHHQHFPSKRFVFFSSDINIIHNDILLLSDNLRFENETKRLPWQDALYDACRVAQKGSCVLFDMPTCYGCSGFTVILNHCIPHSGLESLINQTLYVIL